MTRCGSYQELFVGAGAGVVRAEEKVDGGNIGVSVDADGGFRFQVCPCSQKSTPPAPPQAMLSQHAGPAYHGVPVRVSESFPVFWSTVVLERPNTVLDGVLARHAFVASVERYPPCDSEYPAGYLRV